MMGSLVAGSVSGAHLNPAVRLPAGGYCLPPPVLSVLRAPDRG
jgi:hypothetical protein